MDNQPIQQPQPTPAPTAAPTQPGVPPKKSNAGLVIAIVIIVLVCLPIVAVAILFFGIAGYFSANPDAAKDIADGLNEAINEVERKSATDSYVVGTWNCAKGTGSSNDRSNFSTTLKLKEDGTFTYGQYGDLKNNHYSGTYTAEDEDKHTADGSYDYYMIDFDTDEMVTDGEKEEDLNGRGLSQMEMGITKTSDGKQAITMFTSTYNMYYCYAE